MEGGEESGSRRREAGLVASNEPWKCYQLQD